MLSLELRTLSRNLLFNFYFSLELNQVSCLLECCRHKLVDIVSRKQIIAIKELVHKSNVLTFFLNLKVIFLLGGRIALF